MTNEQIEKKIREILTQGHKDFAYALLVEVRALEMDEPITNRNIYVDGYNKAVEDVLDILSEHLD